MVSAKGRSLAFVSTSDPTSGDDTGVSQIWVGKVNDLPAHRVTSGAGASTEPLVSDERLVAFSSTSDLAGDGADTRVKQTFVYDDRTQTYAQLTAEPGGCGRPAVSRVQSDWRVAYVCGGQAYFHMLREDKRYHVLTPGGVTQSIVPEMGVHFVTLSTTSNLYDVVQRLSHLHAQPVRATRRTGGWRGSLVPVPGHPGLLAPLRTYGDTRRSRCSSG